MNNLQTEHFTHKIIFKWDREDLYVNKEIAYSAQDAKDHKKDFKIYAGLELIESMSYYLIEWIKNIDASNRINAQKRANRASKHWICWCGARHPMWQEECQYCWIDWKYTQSEITEWCRENYKTINHWDITEEMRIEFTKQLTAQ